jgi:hypothetical protein
MPYLTGKPSEYIELYVKILAMASICLFVDHCFPSRSSGHICTVYMHDEICTHVYACSHIEECPASYKMGVNAGLVMSEIAAFSLSGPMQKSPHVMVPRRILLAQSKKESTKTESS